MPTSPEADTASAELKKLTARLLRCPGPPSTRADLFAKGKRYSDAATEYRDLLDEVSPKIGPAAELALAGLAEERTQP